MFLAGGQTTVSEDGPYVGTGVPIDVDIPMAPEIGNTFAIVWVLVRAVDPLTGKTVDSKATTAAAYRQADGTVRLLSEEEAALLTADVGVQVNGEVEDGLVGREVVP